MIEQVDRQIQQWIASLLPSVEVSLLPPGQADQGVTLYLMSLAPAPALRGASRPPLQVMLRYLVVTRGKDAEEAHQMLGKLVFAALANPDFVVDLEPLPAQDWSALGVIPQPAFILGRVLRLDQPEPVAPLVRQPAIIKTTPVTSLSGVVARPDNAPIAGARVELPDLQVVVQTDSHGRFYFAAVPGDPYPQRVRVTVKNRTQDFTIKRDNATAETLVFGD